MLNIGRLYDPRVLRALLDIASDAETAELLGTVATLWIPDSENDDWLQYHNLQPASQNKTDFYRLTQLQLDAMGQVNGQQNIKRLAQHIQKHFPEQAGQDATGLARRYIDEAGKLGFYTRQECFYYSNVLCLLNARQERHPHFTDIQKLLTESSQQTPAQRIKQAAELAAMTTG